MQRTYYEACLCGDTKTVEELLRSDAQLNIYLGIINASHRGHLRIVELHIELRGFNIHVNDDEPFVLACWNNQLEVAKYLLEIGGEKTREIIKEGTPLIGCYPGISTEGASTAPQVFEWLMAEFGPKGSYPIIEKRAILKVTHNCAEGGYVEVFKKLIDEYGINIVDEGMSGSCIRWSCRNYHKQIVQHIVNVYGQAADYSYDDEFAIRFLLEGLVNNTDSSKEIIRMMINGNIIDIDGIISLCNNHGIMNTDQIIDILTQ